MKERLIFFGWGFIVGLLLFASIMALSNIQTDFEISDDYEPPLYQSSAYELKGCIDEQVAKIICYSNGIDYGKPWMISCPRAPNLTRFGGEPHALLINYENDCWLVLGFHFNATGPITRIYCNCGYPLDTDRIYCKCGYPLGTDWLVRQR